jgi:hypothetical protein
VSTRPAKTARAVTTGPPRPPELSRLAMNRALLARQLLHERRPLPALAAVEHLVGLQAQTPNAAYLGLWSRLDGFDTSELSGLMADRQVVRLALMRSTVHMVSARDCLTLRPLVHPVMVRGLLGNFGRQLEGLNIDQIVAAGGAMLEEKPLTWAELGAALSQRWPGREPLALSNAVRAHLALVQIPPRGLWGQGGAARHVPAGTFLGRSLDPSPSVDDMVVRYLNAFGPASVADVQAWSGLKNLVEVLERLRRGLVTFRSPAGRDLFDLPDAPRPDPATPAPVRYLPVFDNLLLSHADRDHVIPDQIRRRLPATAALEAGSVLIDGSVAAAWRVTRAEGATTLRVSPVAPIPEAEHAGLRQEGGRLLSFLSSGALGTVSILDTE